MKRDYCGLHAVVIPFGSSEDVLTQSGCMPVWESHADLDNNHVCDAVQDPTTGLPSTQAWTDCEFTEEF